MLISTTIPSEVELAASLEVVPWCMDVGRLFGETCGVLAGNAVDLIDASIGSANHVRVALVARQIGDTKGIQLLALCMQQDYS